MKEPVTSHLALLILRLGFGLMLLYFGIQKVFPILGGQGFEPTLSRMQEGLGAPAWLVTLAIVSESLGALAIAIGLLTRLAAFGILCTMATATWTHLSAANLQAAPTMKDLFFPAMIGLAALALMLTGAGRFSLDHKLAQWMDRSAKGKSS